MKFFISYHYKTFPINLHFINIVGVCPKHFILTWKKHFSRRKGKIRTDKVPKKFFHFTDAVMLIKTRFSFHFFVICLLVEYKDLLIISNLSKIFQDFILLYKDSFKVQHESATYLLCTNMLYFYVAFFSRKCFQSRIYMISR